MGLAAKSLDRARTRTDGLSQVAREKLAGYSSSAAGGIYESANTASMFGTSTTFDASHSFYNAYRDIPYAAIRPIAARFAMQPLRVAVSPRRGLVDGTQMMTKSLRDEGFLGSTYDRRQKEAFRNMPTMVKQALPPDSVVLDNHMIVEAFRRPNVWDSDYTTLYMIAASMMTAGAAMLTWDERNTSAGVSGIETPSCYYIPISWITPRRSVLDGFEIRPPYSSEMFEIEPGEYMFFRQPNPGDPFDYTSPMKAGAKSINTADKIHDANYHGLQNLINPSYAVVAGQIPSPVQGGRPMKPMIKKNDRAKLMTLIKKYVSGVYRNGDPIILDALIDDIKPLGTKPKELDYVGGNRATEDRISKIFGTSPVVMGYTENANRAGSIVAHEIFYDIVLNPLALNISREMTRVLGPKYSTEQYVVTVYFEEVRVKDPDAEAKRVSLFKERLSDVEARRFIRTGELDFEDDDTTFRDEQETREDQRASRLAQARPAARSGTQNA